jgi:nucleoside-diphosphate-sugar epimerase
LRPQEIGAGFSCKAFFALRADFMIAITGATGFVGRELVTQLAQQGHQLKAWYRTPESRAFAKELASTIDWIQGELADGKPEELVRGCEVVVHAALWRQGASFREGVGDDLVKFARINVLGTLELIQASIAAGVKKFIFVSTCAVHEKILDDRPLDEAHPLWPLTHYGAHKAAIEKFVHSYGYGIGYPICSIRPSGIYGVAEPVTSSKWYSLIQQIVAGQSVQVSGGGKEVHVADVAKGIQVLMDADDIVGESFSCCDRYISDFEVATMSKQICGSNSEIIGQPKSPKHQIDTSKLRALGMRFGGTELLEQTIKQLISTMD